MSLISFIMYAYLSLSIVTLLSHMHASLCQLSLFDHVCMLVFVVLGGTAVVLGGTTVVSYII